MPGYPIALGSGLMQQTPAVQNAIAKASGARGGRTTQRRRRSAKKKVARAARKVKRSAGRLKKGSAAAKAWMKKIRSKRKK